MVPNETNKTILQRMVSRGGQQRDAQIMSVAKAIRLSIPKIGKELFDMPISAIGVVIEKRSSDFLAELVTEDVLLCLLEGDEERVGAALIAGEVVSGLIQQQTIGTVSLPKGTKRQLTQTDAAMCTPLVDELFTQVALMLEGDNDQQTISGFRYGACFADARAMSIALDQSEYLIARLTLDLALGQRQGELILILPVVAVAGKCLDGTQMQEPTVEPLGETILDLPAELNMILCKCSFELSQLEQLSIGQTLPLPNDAFPETDIVTQTGEKIGTGTLGQTDGIRALRLNREPIHASHPRRREADLVDLDLLIFDALPRNKSNIQKAVREREDQTVGSSLGVVRSSNTEVPLPSSGSNETDFHQSGQNNTEDVALPELSDFPDLNDLVELEKKIS